MCNQYLLTRVLIVKMFLRIGITLKETSVPFTFYSYFLSIPNFSARNALKNLYCLQNKGNYLIYAVTTTGRWCYFFLNVRFLLTVVIDYSGYICVIIMPSMKK